MLNLLVILSSLIIQFGVVEYPINMLQSNTEYSTAFTSCAQNLSNSSVAWIKRAGNWALSNPENCILRHLSDGTYILNIPKEGPETNISSNIYISSRSSNGNIYITATNWYGFIMNSNYTYKSYGTNTGNFGNNIYVVGGDSLTDVVVYCYITFPVDSVDTFTVTDDIIATGQGLGALGSGGHSSGSSPFDELNNNGVSWSGSVSGYNITGHSYSNISPVQVDTSSKEQNLLQQIINNTGHTLQNTGKIGESLNNINNNIIQAASALYNAISGFNDNFVSSYIYDEDEVEDTFQNSSFFAFATSTSNFVDVISEQNTKLTNQLERVDPVDHLIIPLDLTKWVVPVYYDSTGIISQNIKPYNEVVQIDFSFLEETKSIWQPLLLGVLYFSLYFSIYFDLPNILRGANR